MKEGKVYTKVILWIFLLAVVCYFGYYIFSAIYAPLTTAAAIIPLYVMGGSVIREFLLPLLVGVVGGTYSSIFIATPLYYDLYHLIHKPKYKGK